MRISDWSSDVCSSDLRSDVALEGGQCWRFLLRLRAPHGSLDPGGFDYEGWLFRQHIGATASVRDVEPCSIASGATVLKLRQARSDERRVGKECVSTCRSRWSPDH